jgi:prepilin-type N-terminal cleavage/methylation domain-containing protein
MQNIANNFFRAVSLRSSRRQSDCSGVRRSAFGARIGRIPELRTPNAERRAFTLIELLVVIGVIAVLVGILFPVINRAYKSSQITAMKFNFHTIADALEAYKQDFGDYPRNPLALTDPPPYYTYTSYVAIQPDVYRPALPRTDPTLAMALLGPGPYSAVTIVSGSPQNTYLNGDADGVDGPGFKTQLALVQTVTATPTAGSNSISVTGLPATLTNPNNPALPLFTVVSLGGPGSPDAHLSVTNIAGSTITVATPVQGNYPAGTSAALLAPTGKTWGPYLPIDKFKVSYSTITTPAGQNYEKLPLPSLLDNWGNPILYVPAYNTYTNHMMTGITSVATGNPGTFPILGASTPTSISVGPLLGWPSGNSALYKYNTPLTTLSQTSSYTGPSVFWSAPLSLFTTGQMAGLLYKLGDHDGNNAINDTESLSVQQPYFLISSGPDGMYTDLYPGTSAPTTGANQYWQSIMNKSDDVYSFDQ